MEAIKEKLPKKKKVINTLKTFPAAARWVLLYPTAPPSTNHKIQRSRRPEPLPSLLLTHSLFQRSTNFLTPLRFLPSCIAHRDKLCITFKAEGDGFVTDAVCDDGYCYQIYFRNDPTPNPYLDMGLSPLLARTMALFDSLCDQHNCCRMDNLYNSAAFCQYAYNHQNRVLIHGVTRKWGQVILPDCVLQEEVKNCKAQIRVRGTVLR